MHNALCVGILCNVVPGCVIRLDEFFFIRPKHVLPETHRWHRSNVDAGDGMGAIFLPKNIEFWTLK